jgi:selenocysteine lyase/cysteine desulfurase
MRFKPHLFRFKRSSALTQQVPAWKELRRKMPIVERWAYFDNAAVAPICGPAKDALLAWSDEAARDGDTAWPKWAQQAECARQLAAEMISASTNEIALVTNTTAGINLVAEGFPWRQGDNVVIPANEFPSNAYPWLNLASRGVETRRLQIDGPALDLDRLFDLCDDRTRLVSLSWVSYLSGWRIDVGEVVERAHRRGILVFLDAIQGLGVFPLDVSDIPVDFLAADGHKWMLGPEGAGFFYLRREHLDLLRPLGVGWNSVVHRHDYSKVDLELSPDASRYEGGSMNMAGMIALAASLQLLLDCGHGSRDSQLADRVLDITDLACETLVQHGCQMVTRRDGEHRSGILTFDVPDQNPVELRRRCLEAGVVLSCRGGHLRISPHAYATAGDIERLVDVIFG